jgi:hypothetical protein
MRVRNKEKYNARNRELYAAQTPEQKEARLAQCRAWNEANKERRAVHKKYTREERAAYMREWRKRNPDKNAAIVERGKDQMREYQAKYYEERKEALKPIRQAQGKAWRAANPAKVAHHAFRRRLAQEQATPAWLTEDDHWIIEEIYSLRDLRSQITGVEHHVDHVYPLRGKTVCGLHVPLNLQVIPAKQNILKRNRLPDELVRLVA